MEAAEVARQVARVRAEGGFARIEPSGIVRIAGSDRQAWLQGMVSNDIRLLSDQNPRLEACILKPTGQLIAVVSLIQAGNDLLMIAATANFARLLARLESLVILEDVALQDVSKELSLVRTEGLVADAVAAATGCLAVPSPGLSGQGGHDLLGTSSSNSAVAAFLCDSRIAEVSPEAVEVLRIEAGSPLFGVDVNETTIPLEAGLEASHISHAKGCYVGQEVVARIHSRGHTNRQLSGVAFGHATVPPPGTRLAMIGDSEREAGRVTSSCFSPTLGRGIALGMLRQEAREPGTRVFAIWEGGSIEGTVESLPFVAGAGC